MPLYIPPVDEYLDIMAYHGRQFFVKDAKRDGTYEDGIRLHTGRSCEVSMMRKLNLPEKVGGRYTDALCTCVLRVGFESVLLSCCCWLMAGIMMIGLVIVVVVYHIVLACCLPPLRASFFLLGSSVICLLLRVLCVS